MHVLNPVPKKGVDILMPNALEIKVPVLRTPSVPESEFLVATASACTIARHVTLR